MNQIYTVNTNKMKKSRLCDVFPMCFDVRNNNNNNANHLVADKNDIDFPVCVEIIIQLALGFMLSQTSTSNAVKEIQSFYRCRSTENDLYLNIFLETCCWLISNEMAFGK